MDQLKSPIKDFTFEVLDTLKVLGYPLIKRPFVKPIADKVVNWICIPGIRDCNDIELFDLMFKIHKMTKKYFDRFDMMDQIKEAENKYNSPKIPRLGDVKKALELIPKGLK